MATTSQIVDIVQRAVIRPRGVRTASPISIVGSGRIESAEVA
jgi:hypothetical protein